jgi:hypothetical protein
MPDRTQVFDAVRGERMHQIAKWGPDEKCSIAAYVLYMEHWLAKARTFAAFGQHEAAMIELRKVTALGVAAMEEHGAPARQPG